MTRRRRDDRSLTGIALVDKPAGWTSHDVVGVARRHLGVRRIGHAGTLDPPATGLLVLGVGPATRLLRYTDGLAKDYTGELVLGTETSTLDDTGEVTARHPVPDLEAASVAEAARALTGPIDQVPPMVSAVQVGGRRLHELAREGIEVDREARSVTVHRLAVTPTADPTLWDIEVSCSAGTYVRTLAADLAWSLGTGGHLRGLRRWRIGQFSVVDAVAPDDLADAAVAPPARVVGHLDRVSVDGPLAEAVGHGKVLEAAELGVAGDGPWAVLDAEGALLAVYAPHRGTTVKPEVGLPG